MDGTPMGMGWFSLQVATRCGSWELFWDSRLDWTPHWTFSLISF